MTKHLRSKIYIETFLVIVTMAMGGYYFIPMILKFPPFSEEWAFQKIVEEVPHIQQYLFLGVLSLVVLITYISIYYRDVFIYYKKNIKLNDIKKIRNKCFTAKRNILILMLVLITFVNLFSYFFVMKYSSISYIFRFNLVFYGLAACGGIFLGILLERDFRKVIFVSYEREQDYSENIYTGTLKKDLMFTVLPLTIIFFIVIVLLGYSSALQQKGEIGYNYYKSLNLRDKIKGLDYQQVVELANQQPLMKESNYYFVIKDNGNTYVSNGKKQIDHFMENYTKQFIERTEGRAYAFYGIDEQAYVEKVTIGTGETIYIGFVYDINDKSLFIYFFGTLVMTALILCLLIYVWAKSFANEIKDISDQLLSVTNSETIDYNKKLAISSDNEIGELIYAYNKIQELNKKYINSINEKQDILIKQEQLVTLGELAGGMAHDINTPIAAINYGIDVLSKQVTDEKQMEIIRTMKDCSLKIITIVNDLRNQIRNLGTNDLTWFKFTEIVKESQVLTHNKLVKGGCTLNVDVDPNLELYGERNKLGQVITNMVVNAIQAYDKMPITEKSITIQAYQDGDNAVIKVTDRAGGIPDQMRESMFKAIMTTKGSEGTGIGMYLAYSVIRSVFKGQLTFETATGAGTTFIMVIPNNKEKINAEIKATPATQTVLPTHVEPVVETPVVNQETSS